MRIKKNELYTILAKRKIYELSAWFTSGSKGKQIKRTEIKAKEYSQIIFIMQHL